ncbi:MAG: hypothetical protein KAV00_05640 [Phycisphaerae bacterium]|nr:hypothetical protein [Phycisphaerae bacterium]
MTRLDDEQAVIRMASELDLDWRKPVTEIVSFCLAKQLELPLHRSTTERCPIERLMDIIAAKVGYYDPIFRPAVVSEVQGNGRLSFAGVEKIRRSMCPNASFQATLIACVERAPVPLIYIEVGMGYKKAERAELASNQLDLFPMDKPTAKLRALVAVRNESAKSSGLRIDPNMQVPEDSVIASHYSTTQGSENPVDTGGTENLTLWRHSDGTPVGAADVRIEARRLGDRVVAIVGLARNSE